MLEVYIDGACEPVNPGGTASYGVLVLRQDFPGAEAILDATVGKLKPDIRTLVREDCGIVGSGPKMSNNVGEYASLVKLLEWMDNQKPENVIILSDSKLLVEQMNFNWKANVGKLYYPYYQQALLKRMALGTLWEGKITFKWIPREQNLADELTVKALSKVGIVRRE